MLPLIAATLLIIVPDLISSQSSKQEWLPDELHNPRLEPRKCGLVSNEPAYICDPNGLLGEHISSINWILKDAAYNSTQCPCSNYYCENEKKPLGYHIGVALVKKMKIQTNVDGKRNTLEDQGQIFASNLESTWNLGRCEEGIILFYSYEDRVFAIYGGSTAMNKLTPYYRGLLSYRSGSRFNEGRIVEAVNKVLFDLKMVLNCDTSYNNDCGLLEIRNGASSIDVLTSVKIVTLLFSVIMFWRV